VERVNTLLLNVHMREEKKIVRVLYPRYRRSSVTDQKSGYDRLPLTAHRWGTKHHVSDEVSPLRDEEEGPLT
jgi:hypothetical protein